MQKVFFIGAGSMAEALINGWISNNVYNAQQIFVSNRSNRARLEQLHEVYGVQIVEDNEQLHEADIVILAMKPKDARSAMTAIAPYISNKTIVLSVLAGIAIATIEQFLGARPIARAMPNTSAMIGMAATGITFNAQVSEGERTQFMQMLEAVGIVHEFEEDKLHAITALSGSGPAYLYYLLEVFEKVGVEYGLSGDVVRQLMVQTIAGSAKMLQQGKDEPATLRKNVTSPGGTTEAGIAKLAQMQFPEAVAEAIRSAENRSRELAQID